MTRAMVLALLVAASVAAPASAATSRTDPRICIGLGSAKACASENASLALRSFMGHKESRAWDAMIFCSGSKHWLRWYCTFSNNHEKGSAVITFGHGPSWKRTVVLKTYVTPLPSP